MLRELHKSVLVLVAIYGGLWVSTGILRSEPPGYSGPTTRVADRECFMVNAVCFGSGLCETGGDPRFTQCGSTQYSVFKKTNNWPWGNCEKIYAANCDQGDVYCASVKVYANNADCVNNRNVKCTWYVSRINSCYTP